MNTVYISVNEIIEYENNPRNNENAIDAVTNSIKAFGFKVPIVVDVNNVIVAGHTRFKAAKKLGIKDIPCIIADDLTNEQITAFRIIDNKTAEIAGWDFKKLDKELRELQTLGVDMTDFGFDNYEVDIDIDDLFNAPEKNKAEGEPKKIKCEHCGELFEI